MDQQHKIIYKVNQSLVELQNISSEIIFGVNDTVLVATACLLILTIQIGILTVFGRRGISKTGKLKFWDGNVFGSENSQQLTDFYTFSHIVHGFGFYYLSGLIPGASVQLRFILSILGESGWEILENSPSVIQRYRQTALAQGYDGDTVINSVGDTISAGVGFIIAHNTSFIVVLLLTIIEEILLAIIICDNLTMNILQLIYPMEKITNYQNTCSLYKKFGYSI